MQTGRDSGWPLVGRDDEVRQALAALKTDAGFHGVVLVGDSGTGKSTLARTLAEMLKSQSATVRFALGTETRRNVPLGAFYPLLTFDAAHEPAVMLAAAHRTLEQQVSLVLVVDDAQLLDPLSATMVHQLAASGGARLIVVIRSGEAVPDALTALWKEQLLFRLDINVFTRAQTGELACSVLGGTVESRLIDELYCRTAGNLLLLRGLLSAGRESGVLVRTDAGWQLHGPLRGDDELYDLVEFQLRSLAPEELDAIEVLATTEVLDWDILRMVSDADAVARLERRGLIQLVVEESHSVARLNHPVIGEAALRHAGAARSRQLNSMLAQQLQRQRKADELRSRLPDVRSRIQLGQFMMRSDLPPDLDLIIDAAASAMAMSNFACGEELARFAFDRGGGLPAAIVLARALSWWGRGDETETVLADVDPRDGADERLIVQWGGLRASNLFFNCGQVERAWQVLADVKKRVAAEAFVVLITVLEVSFGFYSGDLATAIETGPVLCGSDVPPLATLWAAVATSCALTLAGRFDEVHRIANAGLRAAACTESGSHRFTIGLAEATALTAAGDFLAAERIWERFVPMAAGVPEANAMVYAMRGLVQFGRGALPAACSSFRDAILVMSRGFPSGWWMLVTAWSAQAEGARGDSAAAAAALRKSEEAYGPQVAVFLPELELARAWERAAVGQTADARRHALRAAQIARQSGAYAIEMRALHNAVCFGERSHAARLEELAGMLNTPLAKAVAIHARGLAHHEGGLLDAAASRFADLGALALAADAMAQAAGEHARSGDRRKEIESSVGAYGLASQCGLRTPAIKAAARPLPFSGREREIAMLIEAGCSNRQIADRLTVSVRTVEGHLYRTFTKLGINDRDQLIRLLGRDPSRKHNGMFSNEEV
jgi:DNA-binding CsgD family transcriptional regulator/ABC-type oligopeptide transport system ATPase subunit